MNYIITIDQFEGPYDLLLHLIKKDKIDIYDLSIEKITKQYLDYIRQMEELNLSIASEYLVMAADLIELKSKLILPNQQAETNDDYEADPRELLINKLLEYKKYKEVAVQFKKLEYKRKEIYTKLPVNLKAYQTTSLPIEDSASNLSALLDAFAKFLTKQREQIPLHTKIARKEISIIKRSHAIKKLLQAKKQVHFFELFDIIEKNYIIATFLAVLEMARKKELVIEQTHHFGDIILSLRGSD